MEGASTLTCSSIFGCNQVQNGALEVIHYSTQKQLSDVLTKVIKTKQFIPLRDEICVVDFNLLNMN